MWYIEYLYENFLCFKKKFIPPSELVVFLETLLPQALVMFCEIIRKTSFSTVSSKKFELSNLPTYNYSEKWLLCMLLEFSELLWERLWCNHFLEK